MEDMSQLLYQMIESEVENCLWQQEFMFNQPTLFQDLQIQQSQNVFPGTPHCPADWKTQDSENEDISALGELYDIFSSYPSRAFSEISTEDSTGCLETEELTPFESSSIPFTKMGVDSYFGGNQLPTTNDTNRNQFPTITSLLTGFAKEQVLLGNVPSNGAQTQCKAPDNNRNSVTIDNNCGEEGKNELNTNKDSNNESTWKKRKRESDNWNEKAMIESEVENCPWEQEFMLNQPTLFQDLQIQQSQNVFPGTPHCPTDWPTQGSENEDISALGELYDIFSSYPSRAFSEISTEDSTDYLETEELTPFESSSIPVIKMGVDSYLDDTNTNPLPSIKSLLSGFAQEPVLLENVPSNGVRSQCTTPDNNRNSVTIDNNYCEEGDSKKKLNTNRDRNNESTSKKRKHESDNKNEGGINNGQDFPEAQGQSRSGVRNLSTTKPQVSLEFQNLQSTYFKVQKRSLLASEQRLVDAQVAMVARSTVPIQSFQVFVKRCENGKPENDTLGPVRLSPKQELDEYEEQVQKIQFSVDLDSVYRTKEGLEVYNLKKISIQLTNTWRLLVILQLSDGCFDVFESKPFLVKTRRYKNDTKDTK